MTTENEIYQIAMTAITPEQHNYPIIVFRRNQGAMMSDLLVCEGVISTLQGNNNIIFPEAPDTFWYTMTENSLETIYVQRPIVAIWVKDGVLVKKQVLFNS